MAIVRTLLNFMIAGALLGLVVASWAYPRYASWNNSAPLSGSQVCDLPKVIAQVTTDLIQVQWMSAAVGAGLALVAGIVWTVLRRKKGPPAATAAAPPPVAT